jgi:DNA-binding MarR family transcriptional regulator
VSNDDDDLFEYSARARATDPDTSHMAAEAVPVSKLERMFLDALKRHPALTTTEIANHYEMDRDSFSPRAQPLIEKGLIERCGKRLVRNSAGRERLMIAFRLKTAT